MIKPKKIIINLEPEGFSEDSIIRLEDYYEYISLKDPKKIKKEISNADAIITRLKYNLNQNLLSSTRKLKYVLSPTTGTNHIDTSYLQSINASLISLKGETEFLKKISPTAEHAWGLLISLARSYKDAFKSIEKLKWQRDDFPGINLRNKTIGIIGLGRLGTIMAKYAEAFQMKIIYTDIDHKKSSYKQVDLEYLLKASDFISIHVPLDSNNKNLISHKELSLLKKSAFLINTSRGEIINEEALLEALEQKNLAGAALDVVSGEESWGSKIPANNRLIKYANKNSNLIITPHIGGMCPEIMRLTEDFIVKKLIAEIS